MAGVMLGTAALATALAAAGALAAGAATTPSAKPLVLATADVPPGLTLRKAAVRTNAEAARQIRGGIAKVKAWGRVTGYEADYAAQGTPPAAFRAVAVANSFASLYRGAKGAASSLRSSVADCARELPRGALRLGHETHVCVSTSRQNGRTYRFYFVLWREQRVVGTLVVGGLARDLRVAPVSALATRQARRIHAWLGRHPA